MADLCEFRFLFDQVDCERRDARTTSHVLRQRAENLRTGMYSRETGLSNVSMNGGMQPIQNPVALLLGSVIGGLKSLRRFPFRGE